MKNFKQILLALVAVFAAVLLVACGPKSDNGTYVFEPTTDEARERLPSELAYIISDDYKFKVLKEATATQFFLPSVFALVEGVWLSLWFL